MCSSDLPAWEPAEAGLEAGAVPERAGLEAGLGRVRGWPNPGRHSFLRFHPTLLVLIFLTSEHFVSLEIP